MESSIVAVGSYSQLDFIDKDAIYLVWWKEYPTYVDRKCDIPVLLIRKLIKIREAIFFIQNHPAA